MNDFVYHNSLLLHTYFSQRRATNPIIQDFKQSALCTVSRNNVSRGLQFFGEGVANAIPYKRTMDRSGVNLIKLLQV